MVGIHNNYNNNNFNHP